MPTSKYQKLIGGMIIAGLIISIHSFNPVFGLTVRPKTDFNIVTSSVTQPDNLNLPNSIIVAPVFIPNDLVLQDNEWYEGIYYYMATRLGQGDFLAHYIVSKDGQVLQGNLKGDEQRFRVDDPTYNKPIIVLYLADKGQSDFSLIAKSQLSDLIIELANKNAIKLSSVQLRTISFLLTPNEPVTLKPEILGGMWEVSLKQITTALAAQYKPVLKKYTLQVVNVEAPKTAVNYGDTVKVNVTIKNTSDSILYQGTDYEPILAKNGKDTSKFYLNKSWVSQWQTPIMSEYSFIKPTESKTFEISLKVPLYFGSQSEDFHLEDVLGNSYLNTAANITLNINHPSSGVVEITSTETGQLNVRDGPWASSSVISRVTPGQRFIVMERTDSGYTKLDLGSGKSGWVVSKYTKSV